MGNAYSMLCPGFMPGFIVPGFNWARTRPGACRRGTCSISSLDDEEDEDADTIKHRMLLQQQRAQEFVIPECKPVTYSKPEVVSEDDRPLYYGSDVSESDEEFYLPLQPNDPHIKADSRRCSSRGSRPPSSSPRPFSPGLSVSPNSAFRPVTPGNSRSVSPNSAAARTDLSPRLSSASLQPDGQTHRMSNASIHSRTSNASLHRLQSPRPSNAGTYVDSHSPRLSLASNNNIVEPAECDRRQSASSCNKSHRLSNASSDDTYRSTTLDETSQHANETPRENTKDCDIHTPVYRSKDSLSNTETFDRSMDSLSNTDRNRSSSSNTDRITRSRDSLPNTDRINKSRDSLSNTDKTSNRSRQSLPNIDMTADRSLDNVSITDSNKNVERWSASDSNANQNDLDTETVRNRVRYCDFTDLSNTETDSGLNREQRASRPALPNTCDSNLDEDVIRQDFDIVSAICRELEQDLDFERGEATLLDDGPYEEEFPDLDNSGVQKSSDKVQDITFERFRPPHKKDEQKETDSNHGYDEPDQYSDEELDDVKTEVLKHFSEQRTNPFNKQFSIEEPFPLRSACSGSLPRSRSGSFAKSLESRSQCDSVVKSPDQSSLRSPEPHSVSDTPSDTFAKSSTATIARSPSAHEKSPGSRSPTRSRSDRSPSGSPPRSLESQDIEGTTVIDAGQGDTQIHLEYVEPEVCIRPGGQATLDKRLSRDSGYQEAEMEKKPSLWATQRFRAAVIKVQEGCVKLDDKTVRIPPPKNTHKEYNKLHTVLHTIRMARKFAGKTTYPLIFTSAVSSFLLIKASCCFCRVTQ